MYLGFYNSKKEREFFIYNLSLPFNLLKDEIIKFILDKKKYIFRLVSLLWDTYRVKIVVNQERYLAGLQIMFNL